MTYFLTSSPFGIDSPYLNPANHFPELLSQSLPRACAGLFVCSDPNRYDFTDHIAQDMKKALEAEGYSFSAFQILDERNAGDTAELVKGADLIVLAGGHVPTQNAFLRQCGLRDAMRGFGGVVIGISAGSMNCAETVYVQPEEPGEALSPAFQRFAPGLGLTRAMLLPHYQKVKDSMLDGMRLFEEITYPDSLGRVFYAIPDGSFLLGRNGRETLFGTAYAIRDGRIRQICGENEAVEI